MQEEQVIGGEQSEAPLWSMRKASVQQVQRGDEALQDVRIISAHTMGKNYVKDCRPSKNADVGKHRSRYGAAVAACQR